MYCIHHEHTARTKPPSHALQQGSNEMVVCTVDVSEFASSYLKNPYRQICLHKQNSESILQQLAVSISVCQGIVEQCDTQAFTHFQCTSTRFAKENCREVNTQLQKTKASCVTLLIAFIEC